MAEDRTNKRILIGCTGSVASIKIPLLVQECIKANYEVEVVATEKALHFFNRSEIPVPVHVDADEWVWEKKGDPILHIELRRRADIMVIAPLDANTMAKIAYGICDNLLTCIVRAWDMKKPLLFAPAMNTMMWDHPHTAKQIDMLTDLGYLQIPPIGKLLACNEIGMGAMAEVTTIMSELSRTVSKTHL